MGLRLALAWVLSSAFLFAQPQIRLTRVTGEIAGPTDIQNANDGSGRLFLVQQNGIIRIFRNGSLLAQPFLNISARTTGSGERGLLGLAFSPHFADTRRFYVYYTNLTGNIVIALYYASAGNPDVAEVGSEQILLTIPHPLHENHNGGSLRFGPDGYLYAGTGDGGGGGDPEQNGQNLQALLGKILRLDVESQPGTVQIPVSNPFASHPTARHETWAYGLRNPWRTSFDRSTGDFWIADVGQGSREEVNFQPASSAGGQNYGWNRMEGTICYASSNCNQQGLTLPVADYVNPTLGCSVTGGYVYRGSQYAELNGIYFYGDFCSGRIWGISRNGGGFTNNLLLDTDLRITTFGEDQAGELYVADAGSGVIYHIEGTTSTPATIPIEISSNPAGQRFTVDQETTALTAPQSLSFVNGSTHSIHWLDAEANGVRRVFQMWADGPSANPRQFIVTAPASYQGVFSTAYVITQQVNGSGTVSIDPVRVDNYYAQGSTVRVQANPASGYRFGGFSGCLAATGSNAQFVVSQACTLMALFLPEETPPVTALRFVPVPPCRVMDTRDATRAGPFGPPALAADSTRVVPLAQACGLPVARAYSLNVTVVPSGPLGFLTIWPGDQPRPLASTLNSSNGQVVANAALVPAAPNGEVSVYVTESVELILDVNGYFVP